jgi:hypothetical protein
VEEYKLDRIPVWTRIQGIPEGLMKKKELAEKVAKKVGEPPFVVIVNEGTINPAKYLRARVHLDLNKPLVRFVPITLKERKKYPVQYEKLPVFCKFCGLMGHEVMECGDGVHEEDQCQWGDWLKVVFEPSIPMEGGRGRGNRGGFGGRGRGRGRNPGDANEFEGSDMDIAPDDVEGGRVIRKRLIGSEGTLKGSEGALINVPPNSGRVAEKVNLLEFGKGVMTGDGLISTPQKVQAPKRQKKLVNGVEIDDMMGLATSSEEGRREQ